MTREYARHEYHRERLEYNEEIGNHMPCKKEEKWKPVCEAWCSVAPNQGELQILLKQREIQRNADFMM